jgi:hypothetical protein
MLIMLDKIFDDWIREVARWRPPGPTTDRLCRQCIWSPVLGIELIESMPHSARHGLVVRLNAAIVSAFEEQQRSAPDPDIWGRWQAQALGRFARKAESLTVDAVVEHLPQIMHVARQVEMRLQHYIEDVVGDLDQLDDELRALTDGIAD